LIKPETSMVASIAAKIRNSKLLADANAASAISTQAAVNHSPARVTCWRTLDVKARSSRFQNRTTPSRWHRAGAGANSNVVHYRPHLFCLDVDRFFQQRRLRYGAAAGQHD